jgi:serine/threonine protein kinase
MNKPAKKLLFPPPPFEGEKETSKKDYSFECKLGDGAFGQVWRIRYKKNAKVFACKQVAKDRVVKMIEQFRREVLIMYKINHPNVIKLFHHFEEVKNFYLVMEIAEGGNLFQKLAKEGKFEEKKAFFYFRQVLDAVEYLHSRKPIIIHRDIKPENIILDCDGNLKLTDFGWSNYYSGDQGAQRYTVCGTYEYLCPEMVKESGHTPSVDIWCLGILLFEMVSGHTPFKAPTKEALMENISKGKIKFSSHISSPLRSLLQQILEKDPQKRISIKSIKSHEWFQIFSASPNTLKQITVPSSSKSPNPSKSPKPLESITNSFRESLVAFREEIEARNEIVKILKTQIRVAIETILNDERKEDLLQQKILQKRKNVLEVDEDIQRLQEKIADCEILQERLLEIQQKAKLESAIASKKADLEEKDEKIQELKKKQVLSKEKLEESRYQLEDKTRYEQNMRNYLKKLKSKGTVLHKNSQSQITELQISYECLKAKILENETKLPVLETPENKSARELMTFIKENKSKILQFLDFETKVKQVEDNLSFKEFELEKIKIEFLDSKKKLFKETWSEKEAVSLKIQRCDHSKYLESKKSLENLLENSRKTAKNLEIGRIEVLHASEKLKTLKEKIFLARRRVDEARASHEACLKVIKSHKATIENVEMELGLLKSSFLTIEDVYL